MQYISLSDWTKVFGRWESWKAENTGKIGLEQQKVSSKTKIKMSPIIYKLSFACINYILLQSHLLSHHRIAHINKRYKQSRKERIVHIDYILRLNLANNLDLMQTVHQKLRWFWTAPENKKRPEKENEIWTTFLQQIFICNISHIWDRFTNKQ